MLRNVLATAVVVLGTGVSAFTPASLGGVGLRPSASASFVSSSSRFSASPLGLGSPSHRSGRARLSVQATAAADAEVDYQKVGEISCPACGDGCLGAWALPRAQEL